MNSRDKFPCLTSDSPELSASRHSLPLPQPPHQQAEESDLNHKVREHRRKMGYGLMATPSTASQHMLARENVESRLHAVRTHLEGMIREALHHMRKDELWKRLLYGASYSSEGRSVCYTYVVASSGSVNMFACSFPSMTWSAQTSLTCCTW